MIKKTLFTLTALIAAAAMLSGSSAREIMERTEELKSPETVRSRADMTITRGERVLKRQVELIGIDSGENEKVLATVTELPSERVTRILTHTKKGDDDLQWLKMPNDRIKRITTADRSGEFVNSHFFYEDLRSRDIDDYEYKLLGEEKVGNYQCYKIEAVPEPGKSIYDKAIFFVIKTGEFKDFIVRADIFFEGYLFKRMVNYDMQFVDGIITPRRSVMYRLDKRGQTLGNSEIKLTALEYNNPAITDEMFSRDRL